MTDIHIRIEGQAGRVTLARPDALNALTYEMVLAIEEAIDTWREDDTVKLVLLDAEGSRAFCAGGDISQMYATGTRGDYEYGSTFWRDEYRLNAKLFEYPKPVVSFLQGFTMGGGVGVGCHGSHRIVGETSQIAMPECSIGLVPDVGGSLMLALSPGRLGEFLGTTGTRMGPADAIYAGFADHFIPESDWDTVKEGLCASGTVQLPTHQAPEGQLHVMQPEIDHFFAGETLADISRALRFEQTAFTAKALKVIDRNAPLAMASCVEIIHRLRPPKSIRQALELEYRYTHRSMAQGDFIEGIRAAIIDKDRNPTWKHKGPEAVPGVDVSSMLLPLKTNINWEG
ncbi:MAG: enoyl-CoA hydratase/isomerase family protein [Litoreibacter sp.]